MLPIMRKKQTTSDWFTQLMPRSCRIILPLAGAEPGFSAGVSGSKVCSLIIWVEHHQGRSGVLCYVSNSILDAICNLGSQLHSGLDLLLWPMRPIHMNRNDLQLTEEPYKTEGPQQQIWFLVQLDPKAMSPHSASSLQISSSVVLSSWMYKDSGYHTKMSVSVFVTSVW